MQAAHLSVSFDLNGRRVSEPIAPTALLANVLREKFGIASIRTGCNEGVCGSCSVLIDGRTMRSCLMLAIQADGTSITTAEGYAAQPRLKRIQTAFVDGFGAQCGFCTSGMMAVVAEYLDDPAIADHRDAGAIRDALGAVVCRCTGYQQIVALVSALAAEDAA